MLLIGAFIDLDKHVCPAIMIRLYLLLACLNDFFWSFSPFKHVAQRFII